MKKMITIVTVFIFLTAALAGCGGGSQSDGKAADSPQTVATGGSTSMEKVIGFLSEACMEEHGDIKVT